ncbi:MAG: hypothetical protein GJ676_19710 [Rhodobacteraceae bacterium]|nr:hypothetical protein [Paracoccaceae bacterium]
MVFRSATYLVLSAVSVLASDIRPWGEVGSWSIEVDPSVGQGCFAQRQFDDGTLVQIGTVPEQAGGFFAAYNAGWSQIADGQEGLIKFDFGDAKFAGDAVGRHRDDLFGAYAFFDNPEFVSEFAKRNSVKVSGEGGTEIEFSLSGTGKAIEAVLACQAEQPQSGSE